MPDPINEILPFGTAGTVEEGDVLDLAVYGEDTHRTRGHQAGIARRALANTVLRQLAHMSAGLAQFIANRYAPGVVDDADLDKVEAGLLAAIEAIIADNAPDLTALIAHLSNTSNPHVVTAAQAGAPPTARTISTTAPLQGGGDLSADRTLSVLGASTTQTGVVELATNAETATGTDGTRAVTPAALAARLGSYISRVASNVITTGHAWTFTAITDGATPTITLTAAQGFTWALGDDRTFPDVTLPGAGVWLFKITGDQVLSFNAAYTVVSGEYDGAVDHCNVWLVSDGTTKDIYIDQVEA